MANNAADIPPQSFVVKVPTTIKGAGVVAPTTGQIWPRGVKP